MVAGFETTLSLVMWTMVELGAPRRHDDRAALREARTGSIAGSNHGGGQLLDSGLEGTPKDNQSAAGESATSPVQVRWRPWPTVAHLQHTHHEPAQPPSSPRLKHHSPHPPIQVQACLDGNGAVLPIDADALQSLRVLKHAATSGEPIDSAAIRHPLSRCLFEVIHCRVLIITAIRHPFCRIPRHLYWVIML